jgi:hypothetical protein
MAAKKRDQGLNQDGADALRRVQPLGQIVQGVAFGSPLTWMCWALDMTK